MLPVGTRHPPSVLGLLLVVIPSIAIAFYLIISLTTGDWLWFNPTFDETPRAILVHCYGKTLEIEPGSYHFGALTEIVNKALSGRKRWDSLSLSAATYHDYQTHPKMAALELFYHEPVRIHTTYKFFSEVESLIIPLDGRHAETLAVFGLNRGIPSAGSLHIKTTQPIQEYLRNQKLCPIGTSGD